MREYVIYNKSENGFWNNKSGWGNFSTATRFTLQERGRGMDIPKGGEWVPASKRVCLTVGDLRDALYDLPDDLPLRGLFPAETQALRVVLSPVEYIADGHWANSDDGGDNKYVAAIHVLNW